MTNLQGPKRIRALDRGIAVIEHLANNGLSSLADLRTATGLSNATLLRVLCTLQDRNWVRRNIVEGQYELAHSLGDVLGANTRAHPLAELAAPILLNMKMRRLGLPSDLCAIVAPGKIEIIESTRLRGPMAPGRTALGIRPSFLLSAHGRAMMAYLRDEERAVHLQALGSNVNQSERRWFTGPKLDEEREKARKSGFGVRQADYFVEAAFDPGPDLGAIAVPILSSSGVHGSLSVLWMNDDMTLDEVLGMGALEDMRSSSAKIGVALDRAKQRAPNFAEAEGA